MNPITEILLKYDAYLREGGAPVCLFDRFPTEKHIKERRLSASSIGLCDRKAVYDIMEDLGLMQEDNPQPLEINLDFRVGNIMEDFVAQAMQWYGVLLQYQTRLTDGVWKGRLDLLVDANKFGYGEEGNWLIEVKTVKSSDPSILDKRDWFPKDYHWAQASVYSRLLDVPHKVVLLYILRPTFDTKLYTVEDGKALTWGASRFVYAHHLNKWDNEGIARSIKSLEEWVDGGEVPPRCGKTPDEHPFMCCDVNRKTGIATPKCEYFGQCWSTQNYKSYRIGDWSRAKIF